MATQTPSSLDARTLARRLGDLAGDERQVQVDFLLHLDEFLGGTSTPKDLRLACKPHNLFHAEQVYGRKLMRKYRKGESAIAGESCDAGRKAKATG